MHGVSTRKVDDLVAGLGTNLQDVQVRRSRGSAPISMSRSPPGRPGPGPRAFPYVFLDATYCKARVGRAGAAQAVVIATGVSADGRREVLG